MAGGPLRFLSGWEADPTGDPRAWREARAEVVRWFLSEVYGPLPEAPGAVSVEMLQDEPGHGPEGKGRRRTLRLWVEGVEPFSFLVDAWSPAREGCRPVVVCGDGSWRYLSEAVVEAWLAGGWMVVRFSRVEVVPDLAAAVSRLGPRSWPGGGGVGAIAGWAWAYHRVVDWLVTDRLADAGRIAICGHSRGGKAVLLAGALDERIAVVMPNNSGCAGAGSYRVRNEACERVADIVQRFPHWFSPRFAAWAGREEAMVHDADALVALVAPRAYLSTEASGDAWANPVGTRAAWESASRVWERMGVAERVGWRLREGAHGHRPDDWAAQREWVTGVLAAWSLPRAG